MGRAKQSTKRRSPGLTQLGIFAKYWQRGAVKTRLAATFGADQAAEVYRAFLTTEVERLAELADRQVLAVSPASTVSAFREVFPDGWQIEPQCEGDLGARMEHYFSSALAADADRVVLLGSDSPSVPVAYVEQAFASLESNDAVLGPTADGGYYLIGIRGRVPPIFTGVAWSTSQVWEQTVTRLQAANLTFAELPDWYDVDDAADLQRLRHDLVQQGADDAHLQALSARLVTILGE